MVASFILLASTDFACLCLEGLLNDFEAWQAEEAEQQAIMMVKAGQTVMQLTSEVLSPALKAQLEYGGQLEQVGLSLAESMAIFGSKYFSMLPQESRLTFLDQVLPPHS